MKSTIYAIAAAITFTLAWLPASAATDKEMEEARTYAAQAYLRYANDGSGYLDEFSAKTMAELKGKLKAQELENLKSFESVAVPKDYASWDKARLTEYWSKTFFASPGLLEKGRHNGAMTRVRKKIGTMNVSVNSSAPSASGETAPQSAGNDADPLAGLEADPNAAAAAASLADSIDAAAKELEDAEAMLGEEKAAASRGNSYTWIYVVILAVLVGVVIWLVIFASKVMKKSEQRREERDYDDDERKTVPVADVAAEARLREADREAAAMRERFAATLAGKNDEVREMRRGADILRAENDSLKGELAKAKEALAQHKEAAQQYKEECERLFEENKELHARLAKATVPTPPTPSRQEAPAPKQEPARPTSSGDVAPQAHETAMRQTPVSRTIFLGRANRKGLFVRADRKLNIGHTVFRLDTADGYAGTFRVAADPGVWETALLRPVEMLAGACLASDMEDTAGKSRIVTESPGTAIFEDGCWKVIRKAKIRFEE